MMRKIFYLCSIFLCSLTHDIYTAYSDQNMLMLVMSFYVSNGSGDDPMISIWAEDNQGQFIGTLYRFSKEFKYWDTLTEWYDKSAITEPNENLDAISGATITWNDKRTIAISPSFKGHDLLNGNYIIRIESCKDKGGHYKSFNIPITDHFKGGIYTHNGYVCKVKIIPKELKVK